MSNADAKTIIGFGEEWARFDQSALSQSELQDLFHAYFGIFPFARLPEGAIGFDLGCGSGRWATCTAPRVGTLHCIDPSGAALEIAKRNLRLQTNCQFHLASVDSIPLDDNSMDFGYALGVLHHIPDTYQGIEACVRKLKPGAPLLLYLYYSFDNRPLWFRLIWRLSDLARRGIARLPSHIKQPVCDAIAAGVYFPLARMAYLLERFGMNVESLPLSAYRHRSYYTLRTDALDRFGTALEHRFTKAQIAQMMERAGLERIEFSPNVPYWCAVGYRAPGHS
jgi:ubiquinone/menaquinone biosynthesis C-methylase UbiE